MCYSGCLFSNETVFRIIWFFLLITAAFPIALLCAPLYVLFSPYSVCYDTCEYIVDLLLYGLQLPYRCTEGIVEATPVCCSSYNVKCWVEEQAEQSRTCCVSSEPKPKKKKTCCCDPPDRRRRTCCENNPDFRQHVARPKIIKETCCGGQHHLSTSCCGL